MLVTKTILVSTLALLANAANPTITSITPAQVRHPTPIPATTPLIQLSKPK